MANREQRSSKEKKKPKSDKKAPQGSAAPGFKAPAYVEPQLIRKPHKGKDWT